MNRIVFAGTPAFALASLAALVAAGHTPVAVYTQPDRPAGRGRRLTPGPVKTFALEQRIEVLQPTTLRGDDAAARLAALAPDLLVVAAYGLILPQAVLDVPARGCVNVHASLLPRWRGAAPIQASLLAGDAETGISLMQMTAGLDCGPVFCQRAIPIDAAATAADLHDALAILGGELLVEKLPQLLDGSLEATPQDDTAASYAGKIRTADARLDWALPAAVLARQVRAYNPVPGAFFEHSGQRIKVWAATALDSGTAVPGTLLQYDDDGIVFACGAGALRLDELQAPGRRRAPARQFVGQVRLDR